MDRMTSSGMAEQRGRTENGLQLQILENIRQMELIMYMFGQLLKMEVEFV